LICRGLNFIIYFDLFSIRLSQSHDLDRKFGGLTRLTWVFLPFFNQIFFLFHHSTFYSLKNRFHNLFWFAFYEVILVLWSKSHVWQVNSCHFFNFFLKIDFFSIHWIVQKLCFIIYFNLLDIWRSYPHDSGREFRILTRVVFWFAFYEVILVSWHRSREW
jgi:hypothetical protein